MKREQVLALYDAYADGVYRVALGYLRSTHDAEDAVQAVFCKLLEQARPGTRISDKADGQPLQKSALGGKAVRAGAAGRA